MKHHVTAIFFLIIVVLAVPGMGISDNIIDLPPSGTDASSIRCQGKIVSTGTSMPDVLDLCEEPLDRGQLVNRTYEVWVYRFDGSAYVNYLAFRNRRLQRIYRVSCIKDDPYCQ